MTAGPAKERERPSYLSAEIERMKKAYEVSNLLWWVAEFRVLLGFKDLMLFKWRMNHSFCGRVPHGLVADDCRNTTRRLRNRSS